jgi:calcineurin-like phosphoesterase family protein
MANVLFCSDLHFGHANIGKFRKNIGESGDAGNRNVIENDWREKVTKRDIVYVLGDAAFSSDGLMSLSKLPGKKILIRGNHDTLPIRDYLDVFDEVYGLFRYKEFWLSHAPIHPEELRGKVNLHGHVHSATLKDSRYFNCCPENLWDAVGSSLASLQEVRGLLK